MAKVLKSYSAVTENRTYFRPEPSFSVSGSLQVEAGYVFHIHVQADGSPWLENGFYRSNEGWIHFSDITITGEVYETITDKCIPPKNISLNTSTKVLTISGGAGGDLNTFTGYGISWRDAPIGTSSYGAWLSDVVVNSSNTTVTYNVIAPSGYVRQFRARTLGSAGASYYSDYVIGGTTLTGNSSPKSPVIKIPSSNAITIHPMPYVVIECLADPDGDVQTLKRQLDNGSWENVTTLRNGTFTDQLPTLQTGSHTVKYKLADQYFESSVASVSFVVSSHAWNRTINSGDVISNAFISHKDEINDMLSAVNIQRAWHGLDNIGLAGSVGQFATWKKQMEALLEGINACALSVGMSATALSIPSYPTAAVINAIRKLITSNTIGENFGGENRLDRAVLDQMILS